MFTPAPLRARAPVTVLAWDVRGEDPLRDAFQGRSVLRRQGEEGWVERDVCYPPSGEREGLRVVWRGGARWEGPAVALRFALRPGLAMVAGDASTGGSGAPLPAIEGRLLPPGPGAGQDWTLEWSLPRAIEAREAWAPTPAPPRPSPCFSICYRPFGAPSSAMITTSSSEATRWTPRGGEG